MELLLDANDTFHISESAANIFIIVASVIGIIFGLFNYYLVMRIKTTDEDRLLQDKEENIKSMNQTAEFIQEGANAFLLQEYVYLAIFIVIFFVIILAIDSWKGYTAIAFVLGALASTLSGYFGMFIATRTNVRVTFQAACIQDEKESLKGAFNTAFRGGCTMGFFLTSLALLVLALIIIIYKAIIGNVGFDLSDNPHSYTVLFEYVAGYGLGGSTVALFCRVGGGIYTKAADVGADLVGKNEFGLGEDSPENPATIADNVGDNVGDIAGMGSDLFGSFAESTCAALVVSASSRELVQGGNYLFPLILSAGGILVCIITSFFATHVITVTEKPKIEKSLRYQLIISSVLLTPLIILLSLYALPEEFSFYKQVADFPVAFKDCKNWGVMICGLCGLWSGMGIGYITDIFTSTEYSPVQNLSKSCKSGAAINIIQGLALGYLSNIIPIILLAITICTSFKLCGMYGISIAALGMLSNLAIALAIDGYGPISDNAGGISEMSGFPEEVRKTTDALDAAGNTTAAIGKGFAIGSACLVGLALFGAFLTRARLNILNILSPIEISCLLIGSMMPYAFSALTMKSVGSAATEMCEVVKRQINEKNSGAREALDYKECIQVSTKASLKEMILPGVLVIFTPLIIGMLFGPNAVAGYLAGVIVSGVQMAISSSNSGGAWDNAKKYIEAKRLEITEEDRKQDKELPETELFYAKKSEPHKAAVVGDTVGDPLKDTSGPSINILIKLSSIVSLVFADFISEHHFIKNF